MKLLQVHTFYQPYLNYLYENNPGLADKSYSEQNGMLINDGFSASHMIAPHLHAAGYQAELVVANAIPAQIKWAVENGVKPQSKENFVYEILYYQIQKFDPDILYLTDPITFDSNFINILPKKPKLVLGWRAASIPPQSDFSSIDLLLSNHRESIEEAIKRGVKATERFSPGMPAFITEATQNQPKEYDVVFTGQVSPEHTRRLALLEHLAKFADQNPWFKLGLFIPNFNSQIPPSLQKYNHGARWGLEMYKSLASGKIVFNAHIDLVKNEAANMRMFETTAVGSLLLTEHYDNIGDFFQPEKEIATYTGEKNLIEKIAYYLQNPELTEAVAASGQTRCMIEHSMDRRIELFDSIVKKYISGDNKVQADKSWISKATEEEYTLKGSLQNIIDTLSNSLDKYPRRKSGRLLIDGKTLLYADLHSFYHQVVQIFGQKLYDFESKSENPVILDCGAHVGIASLYFGTKYPNAKITAFEADPELAEMTKNNLNRFGVNAEVVAKAVWINEKGVNFNISSDDSGFVNEDDTNANIPSVRLRNYIQNNEVELLKLDIEGSEYTVLEDISDVLGNVDKIIAELHQFKAGDARIGELLSFLEQAGFNYALTDNHPAVWLQSEEKPPFPSLPTEKFIITVFAWKQENKQQKQKYTIPAAVKKISKPADIVNLGHNMIEHPDWNNHVLTSAGKEYFVNVMQNGIPGSSGSADFIYQSHVLEHFPKPNAPFIIRECYRMLKPGGVLRVAVPDLRKIAEEYIKHLKGALKGNPASKTKHEWILLEMFDQTVRNSSGGEMLQYWAQNPIPAEEYIMERMGREVKDFLDLLRQNPEIAKSMNRNVVEPAEIGNFRLGGEVHYWMYDEYSLGELLKKAGFKHIYRTEADDSAFAEFSEYNIEKDKDGFVRKPDSLFMEAVK